MDKFLKKAYELGKKHGEKTPDNEFGVVMPFKCLSCEKRCEELENRTASIVELYVAIEDGVEVLEYCEKYIDAENKWHDKFKMCVMEK